MTREERLKFLDLQIEWKGDFSDDCTAEWAGLMLRAEWMDEDYWWWAVYDMIENEKTIDDSTNYSISFLGGDLARKKAEEIAINYIKQLTNT